tara:strand:- start:59 stop:559 length:501 start_codon:yes stop_codon:yes gene_type:complete
MGFKKTSDLIAISFGVDETAANTFTEEEIALQLDVLNNEIFVVLAVDLNVASPEMIINTNTATRSAVTSTTQTAMATLSDSNCLAVAQEAIRSDAVQAVGFQRNASESYTGMVDYIGLIATNNFFVSCEGTNNSAAKGVNGRVWGYRAKADASTYAALVQSEVLSA